MNETGKPKDTKLGFVLPDDCPVFDEEAEARAMGRITARERDILLKALESQDRCRAEAERLVDLYWSGFDKAKRSRLVCPADFEQWLSERKPLTLDRWFYIHLIEAAGKRALQIGESMYRSEIAKSKNADARAWVLSEWQARADRGQSKASFGRQYAPIVKKRFHKDSAAVTAETIARDWLPKGKS